MEAVEAMDECLKQIGLCRKHLAVAGMNYLEAKEMLSEVETLNVEES
jgi:hypothetical protein